VPIAILFLPLVCVTGTSVGMTRPPAALVFCFPTWPRWATGSSSSQSPQCPLSPPHWPSPPPNQPPPRPIPPPCWKLLAEFRVFAIPTSWGLLEAAARERASAPLMICLPGVEKVSSSRESSSSPCPLRLPRRKKSWVLSTLLLPRPRP